MYKFYKFYKKKLFFDVLSDGYTKGYTKDCSKYLLKQTVILYICTLD